ncbi:MAG: glycerophosphodiester phosphodiesterase family protein [Bacteroidetes bacterium]|nr:glycerophosphodiester phosphodiesterase family protein [Bacteroidota bacterium]
MIKKIALLTFASTIFANVFAQETKNFKRALKEFLDPESKTVLVCAHRGAHNDYPENSLASFKEAIALGIDIFEMDIRATKDDSLVIMHDKSVDRTTNGHGNVADLTFAEIKKMHLKFNNKITDEKVPTFEEALLIARGKILVDLDIKINEFARIIKVINRTKTKETVFALLYEPSETKQVKELSPGMKTLSRVYSEGSVDTLYSVTGSEAVHIDANCNTAVVVNKIKSHGSRVFINALGDDDEKAASGNADAYMEELKNGANIIQTNYPALLKQYLEKKRLR